MGLADPLLRAIEALNFTEPTNVQSQAIPNALAGGDWMVSSHTGSGKTLAFLAPALNRIISHGESPLKAMVGPYALVLCPTRELAQQVAQDAINLVRQTKGVRIATVVGGTPFGKQIASLRGAQLLIATPGRLLDLVNQRKLNLSGVEIMVVDEADRMLDLGFSEDLEAIHHLCENRDQTLMYSATFAPKIMSLAAELMDNPQRLALAAASETNAKISQQLFWADNHSHKRRLLNHWLSDTTVDQAVVFASTQTDTEVIARELESDGHSAIALHGAMPQAVRNRRLKGLREGQFKILVATDVAARGIDVPSISHVINFGMPMKAEDYVHRIGRTGRAGREGTAITLAESSERRKVVAIERYIKQSIPVSTVEGMEPKGGSSDRKGSGGFGKRREGGVSFNRDNARSDAPRREFKPRGDFEGRREFTPRDGQEPRREFKPRGEFEGRREFTPRDGQEPRREFKPRGEFAGRREFTPRDGQEPRREFKPRGEFAGRREFTPRDGQEPRREFTPREGQEPRREFKPRSDFSDRREPSKRFESRTSAGFDKPARSFSSDRPARPSTRDGADSRPRSAAPQGRPKSFSDRPSFAARGEARRRG